LLQTLATAAASMRSSPVKVFVSILVSEVVNHRLREYRLIVYNAVEMVMPQAVGGCNQQAREDQVDEHVVAPKHRFGSSQKKKLK